MDITLGEEKIVELLATFDAEQIREKALAKRVDAFGSIAKFMSRPRADEIEITQSQKRYEPFWYGAARAHYQYDRRHRYEVPVAAEVRAVTFHDHDHPVQPAHTFQLDAVEHCEEDVQRVMMLDAQRGEEKDFSKYLTYGKRDVASLEALQGEGALVISPEVRSSYLVGKLTQTLMKVIQADQILDERIDVSEVILYYRPIYAFEYWWKAKDKRTVVEYNALTGEARSEPGQMKKQVVRVLDNDTLFDIGADTVGTFVPGMNVVIKLGRFAARQVLK